MGSSSTSPGKYKLIVFFYFYLFMIVTERERERERERGRDIGRGRSRLHTPGAQCGIRSRVSRIAPWAKGRRQTAAPPRDPWQFSYHSIPLTLKSHGCFDYVDYSFTPAPW